jgi:coenzyme F420 biosynthesis associated uncharacterized protein
MKLGDNGGVTFAAERLLDWRTAGLVGRKVAGIGAPLSPVERAKLFEDFGELVPHAERLVEEFTALSPGPVRSRPWVMTRDEWLDANLRGFERFLEPFARKVLTDRSNGTLASMRRRVLGAQLGGLLGYLGHRVLGQYDMFLPPDDDGLIYFVGANVAGVERKFRFPPREFRLWIALHEVTHRLQFGGAPWLRGHLSGLMESYLDSVEIDPGWLIERLRTALADLKAGRTEHRGFGWVFLLMTPDQRDLVRRMQATMSLLEGHASYVMDGVSVDRISSAGRFRRTVQQRRTRAGVEKAFQKAIGFDVKVRQYDLGQRFVSIVVERVGTSGFNRVWQGPASLPTMDEIGRPDDWVARVHAS